MHLPSLLEARFRAALSDLTDQTETFAAMIRGTNDPKFGDYQSNCAMPLAKSLSGKNPRLIADEIVSNLDVADLCETPEVAGPGFINLKLKDSFLLEQFRLLLQDERCLVKTVDQPASIVVDFSSPNVAKPMHVGHIRSTVIGDALARVLHFLGYQTITDNHLGDWGTQFGIIIYGYKHFGDPKVVAADPVPELAKLYRLVNQLIEYRKAIASVEALQGQVDTLSEQFAQAKQQAENAEAKEAKKARKAAGGVQKKLAAAEDKLAETKAKITAVDSDPQLKQIADQHPTVDKDVLGETVKLHQGDAENLKLWTEFLPHCKDEINRIYDRLNVQFDHTLGESFYHSMLQDVVDDLSQRGLATESDGATCVFLDDFDAPMIVRKQDGAFLYATTDLATLKYRLQQFDPAEILYVVDTRQSEHFDKLFAVARRIGMQDVKLVHVNFGTVLGEDGRPMKTRSGTLIGLEGLLDDAVARARDVVCNPERLSRFDPPMDESEQHRVAEVVGIGAIKFADLAHHRSSDYKFNLDKMVALEGNTAAYVQYSYARTQSIIRRSGLSENQIIDAAMNGTLKFSEPAERNLVLTCLRFEEALTGVHQDYAPNQLVDYLLELSKAYAVFNDNCHVLNADTEEQKTIRLALVCIAARLLKLGLSLLGVDVVERM
tara:strand:- start:39979 stop:41961 length:1983 start_codon:yes stop_codon:yes gene_type:complete